MTEVLTPSPLRGLNTQEVADPRHQRIRCSSTKGERDGAEQHDKADGKHNHEADSLLEVNAKDVLRLVLLGSHPHSHTHAHGTVGGTNRTGFGRSFQSRSFQVSFRV